MTNYSTPTIMNAPKLTSAINANNEWVHIDSVPNGNKCGCFCPYCHKPLWAKHDGSVMQHHFAHAKDENCTVSHESALHILAKDIIKEKKAVMAPDYYPKRYTKEYEQTPENAEEYLWRTRIFPWLTCTGHARLHKQRH